MNPEVYNILTGTKDKYTASGVQGVRKHLRAEANYSLPVLSESKRSRTRESNASWPFGERERRRKEPPRRNHLIEDVLLTCPEYSASHKVGCFLHV